MVRSDNGIGIYWLWRVAARTGAAIASAEDPSIAAAHGGGLSLDIPHCND